MPGQNDPGTVVMSVPLSVHPHRGVSHGVGVVGSGDDDAMFVTSVSNRQPASPASPPELEPLDEPLEEPDDEPLDEPLEPPDELLLSLVS